MTPTYHDRELGLREAERINRLLGLRLKYMIGIPVGVGAAWLAASAGANQMVSVIVMIGTQLIYGFLLGVHDGFRQAWKRRRRAR